MSNERFEAKSAWELFSFGFLQGREYEALDSLEAMRTVGEFEDRQRETVTKFDALIEARISAAVEAERERLKTLVTAFAHNKMHKPWTVELAALFEVVK